MQVKGRYLVIGWTAVFLAVAFTIVLRARRGFATQHRLQALVDSVQAMRAVKSNLTTSITNLRTHSVLRERLGPLGFRDPSDSEVVNIYLPPDR